MPAEEQRLAEDSARGKNWKRWGPYLAERQWGTVREDYSPDGTCWDFFPHDHARSRAYRWGEDGLLGFTDRECRLCFALALWNGRDPILKERLFGLGGPEGNHGEDVKECYFYLDSTPTHSYLKALYKYPQAEFPYAQLVEENRRRGRQEPEFELADTGIFNDHRYFDIFAEYAKASPDDILIRLTVANRGPDAATLHVLPTLWFRNTWSWKCIDEECGAKPRIALEEQVWGSEAHGVPALAGRVLPVETGSTDRNTMDEIPRSRLKPGLHAVVAASHETLGRFNLIAGAGPDGAPPTFLFTENESNFKRLFNGTNASPYVKDGFGEFLIHGRTEAINPGNFGTKAAAYYRLNVPAGGEVSIRLRLSNGELSATALAESFEQVFAQRIEETDQFYAERLPEKISREETAVVRQCCAGLLWSKQFYHYVVTEWLDGDPGSSPPPSSRKEGRNHDWTHLYNRDVIAMPDKWEYPWFAAWDLAFHMVAMADLDATFVKDQIVLFLREWYMHPNGQLPAYEFAFSDVNPPVHAWAAWRVYKITGGKGVRDRQYLARVFQKLLINFTWWVNRKDVRGKNLFSGGFLGLDNIGVFDRSKSLPTGGFLEQADGTAWMAFYCNTMLAIALKLAEHDPAYEDMASKFFEHFVAIADSINFLGGSGLWDEADGFYYDQLHVDGVTVPLKVRSMVGLLPLIAVEVLEQEVISKLPGFSKRMQWFLDNRPDLAEHISYCEVKGENAHSHRLLAIPSRDRLERVLRYLLDENEFLSPCGIRSLSRIHARQPFVLTVEGREYRVGYEPGESASGVFGGNSNWRGPVWFPLNYLLIEALERYHHFYGDNLRVECPTGSGHLMNLQQVAQELNRRLARIFLPDEKGRRPCHGPDERFATDPHWRNLILFHEYFHGETGRGLGASHQTGWTALVARCLGDLVRS